MTEYHRTNKAGTYTAYRWQLRTLDADGNEIRLGKAGYSSYEDAQNELADARRGIVAHRPRNSPTVAAYAEEWVGSLRLAASTIAGYRRLLKHVSAPLGHRRLDGVTPTDISRLYRDLEKSGRRDSKHKGEPLSANTIGKIHTVLVSMLTSAVTDGQIQSNPASEATVRPPSKRQVKAAQAEITVWTAQQLRAFLDWDESTLRDDLYPLWATIAGTGLRRSEALGLRWSDISGKRISLRRALDTEARDKFKTPKSGKARVVDIDEDLAGILSSWRAQLAEIDLRLAGPDSLAFGNLSGGTRSPNEVSRRWRTRVAKAQKDIDIPTITLHQLRHTHATLLLLAGVHPRVVQERLGHATISITMDTYSHVLPSMQSDAVARFSALLSGEN